MIIIYFEFLNLIQFQVDICKILLKLIRIAMIQAKADFSLGMIIIIVVVTVHMSIEHVAPL